MKQADSEYPDHVLISHALTTRAVHMTWDSSQEVYVPRGWRCSGASEGVERKAAEYAKEWGLEIRRMG
jgi:hypothetical protein